MAQVTLGTGRRASHSKAEGKAQSGDPTGQRSEQEGAPPHPQVLTWNAPAGRHGAGTVCSPRATMLLMSRARCENHAERPRGRRCACSREAAEPALALATVSESPPCGEQCGPIREEFSSLLPLTLRIMDPPRPPACSAWRGRTSRPACSSARRHHHLPWPSKSAGQELITNRTEINELFF